VDHFGRPGAGQFGCPGCGSLRAPGDSSVTTTCHSASSTHISARPVSSPFDEPAAPEFQHSDRARPSTTTCGTSNSTRIGGRLAAGHFVEDAAQVPDEIAVNKANPAATPRHNQPGEHKSAFNNQTAAGAATTSYRPPSPRWRLWTFKRPTRNPTSNSTPNT
jgi:hypothetical protein